MKQSMKKNAVLMVAKTTLSLIVPIITFPYISRVLMVDALGKYNFSNSIVSYFLLIAGLGVSTYAIREGSKIRENRTLISEFVSEMYLINWISTSISYFMLGICLIFSSKLEGYSILILILSLQLLFTVYGRSWVYNIFEDFGYVMLVQVAIQFISVVALFVFVHEPKDLNVYAAINVISSTGANLLYGIHAKQYVELHRVKISSLKKHFKPILIIFSTSVATTIYVNSDMTILGWLVDDRSVGIYSTAVKIYNIIKQILVAVITVTIPRLTLLSGTEAFKSLFSKVLNMLFFMSMPAMTGLLLLSDNVVTFIAGGQYVSAASALRWLSVAMIFALLACLFGMSVLLPYNKEKVFFKSTVISACVNIIANFILIPIYKQDAAAFTTVLSQFIAFLICFNNSKKYIEIKASYHSGICTILGCCGIAITCIVIKMMKFDILLETSICIVASIVVYLMIELFTQNLTLYEMVDIISNIIRRKIDINDK